MIITDYTVTRPSLVQERTSKAGTVTAMQLITPIPRTLGSIVLFQPLVEWAGSSQKRIKRLRVGCVTLYIFANLCAIINLVSFIRYAVQSRQGYHVTSGREMIHVTCNMCVRF